MKTKEVIKTYFANKTVVKWTTMKKFFDLYPNIKKLADYIFKRNKNWESSTNVILGIARNEYLPYCKYCHKQLTYTSKCSFLDNQQICKHEKYAGRRIKRGLFKTANKKFINADLNGSLNILKKAIGEFQYSIQACSTPKIIYLS